MAISEEVVKLREENARLLLEVEELAEHRRLIREFGDVFRASARPASAQEQGEGVK